MAEAQPPTELAVKELNTTTGGEAWCAAAAAATNALQPTCLLSVRHTHKIDSCPFFTVPNPQVHRGEDGLRKFAHDAAEPLAQSVRQGR